MCKSRHFDKLGPCEILTAVDDTGEVYRARDFAREPKRVAPFQLGFSSDRCTIRVRNCGPQKPVQTTNASVIDRRSTPVPAWSFAILFFISGCPALLYQIVWQRALFAIYGVNIETVTIVVTVFMLGLGFGSLLGGWLSKIRGLPILAVFGAMEAGIGLFGLVSLWLFHRAALWTAGASEAATAAITFCLLIFPTLLMGSTLPLLVKQMSKVNGNIGESVGLLYAVNTFGSAAACFLAAFWLMRAFGQSGSVRIAVVLNITVACGAFALSRITSATDTDEEREFDQTARDTPRAISFSVGLMLAFLTGLVSLGYEIVWYRLYSFGTGGVAPVFALLLGFYLAGIGLGSLLVRDLSKGRFRDEPAGLARMLGGLILWGGVLSFLVGPALATAVQYMPIIATLPLVTAGAALLGAAFPLVCHAAIGPGNESGSKVSCLYVANILGSSVGSFVVGFVLMEFFHLASICLFLLVLAAVASAPLLLGHRRRARLAMLGFVSVVALSALTPRLYARLYEKLFYKNEFNHTSAFSNLVETRSGVVAVDSSGTVYGGGVYDGRFNTDPVHDTNGVFRPYAVAAMHAKPEDVLMVGLSSGSWAQIVANHPYVRRMTIVEINQGYLQLIPQYPMVEGILHNSKVDIPIDDGRRWLVRNPGRKFDVIIMNTTYSWRASASNLLSVEFLNLTRKHLKPGGILFFNTTWSHAALFTGATVFPYSMRLFNFLAVSDEPIHIDKSRWEQVLSSYAIDGRPVFNGADPLHRQRLQEILALADTVLVPGNAGEEMRFEPGASLRARLGSERLISDDNMGDEWTGGNSTH
jgi:spermidine synthase